MNDADVLVGEHYLDNGTGGLSTVMVISTTERVNEHGQPLYRCRYVHRGRGSPHPPDHETEWPAARLWCRVADMTQHQWDVLMRYGEEAYEGPR